MGTFLSCTDSRHGPGDSCSYGFYKLFCKNILSTGLLLLLSRHQKNTVCRSQAVTLTPLNFISFLGVLSLGYC